MFLWVRFTIHYIFCNWDLPLLWWFASRRVLYVSSGNIATNLCQEYCFWIEVHFYPVLSDSLWFSFSSQIRSEESYSKSAVIWSTNDFSYLTILLVGINCYQTYVWVYLFFIVLLGIIHFQKAVLWVNSLSNSIQNNILHLLQYNVTSEVCITNQKKASTAICLFRYELERLLSSYKITRICSTYCFIIM